MTNTLAIKTALRRWMEMTFARSMHDWAHYVKESGFTMQQFRLLMQLYYQGSSCGISQISDDLSITAAAASQLVEKMVQSGLLERAEDPSDRRAKLLALSATGSELIEKGNKERYRWMDHLAETLSEQDQAKVNEALILLIDASRKIDR